MPVRSKFIYSLLALIAGLSCFAYLGMFSSERSRGYAEENTNRQSDTAADSLVREMPIIKPDRSEFVESPNSDLDLEQFRGLTRRVLIRKLIETDNFKPNVLLALIERNLIDVNEILRDEHENGTEHYTPLFAALVTGEATKEHIEAFIDYGAYIDPSLEAWNYIVAKESSSSADILIQHAKYDHQNIWRITELAFHFRNMALFRHLAEQNHLPREQLDLFIESTAARLAQNKNTGAPIEPLVEQVLHLQALPSLNSEQTLRLIELEKELKAAKQ